MNKSTSVGSPVLQAITKLGGGAATAAAISAADPALALERSTVQYWLTEDTLPAGYMRIIYKLTGIPVENFLEHEEKRVKTKKSSA